MAFVRPENPILAETSKQLKLSTHPSTHCLSQVFDNGSKQCFPTPSSAFSGLRIIPLLSIMWRPKTYYKLSDMTDEVVNALIDSVTTDDDTGSENEGDFDSDNDVADPDYLCEEDELAIDHCLNSNGMINESLNLSTYCNPDDVDDSREPVDAPSPLPSTSASISSCIINDSAPGDNNAVDDPVLITNASTDFVAQRVRKRKLQAFSKLQEEEEEEGGPTSTSTHGRTGIDMNEIKKNSAEFKSILWGRKNLQLHVNQVVWRGTRGMPAELKIFLSSWLNK
ncbi:hypothetical protein JTB14_029130 [Gonioctena quinquepunctata]|nr:hypothetical protein JTB14_029130 [Gonioctena quinquepunctata]